MHTESTSLVALPLSDVDTSQLAEAEVVIERGLGTFVEVGAALLAIRDARLYRQTHGTFEEYCRGRWNLARNYANKLIAASVVVSNVGTTVPIPSSERIARPLTQLQPDEQREVWRGIVETHGEKVTAADVTQAVRQRIATASGLAPEDPKVEKAARVLAGQTTNIHVSDESYEWYTPVDVIEHARIAMGTIDCDPATCAAAQDVVQAGTWYTKDDDALGQDWLGNVWLNPPYDAANVAAFTAKLLCDVRACRATAAVLLVNNCTETDWFQSCLRACNAICLFDGRLKFWGPNGTLAARQGQVAFYFGPNVSAFAYEFMSHGVTMVQA